MRTDADRAGRVGFLLGLVVLVYTIRMPGLPSWLPFVIAGAAALLVSVLVAVVMAVLPAASPRATAALSTAWLVAGVLSLAIVIVPRSGTDAADPLAAWLVPLAAGVHPFVVFRLVVVTVDRFESFDVSLVAGLVGSGAGMTVTLLSIARWPAQPMWLRLGAGASSPGCGASALLTGRVRTRTARVCARRPRHRSRRPVTGTRCVALDAVGPHPARAPRSRAECSS